MAPYIFSEIGISIKTVSEVRNDNLCFRNPLTVFKLLVYVFFLKVGKKNQPINVLVLISLD